MTWWFKSVCTICGQCSFSDETNPCEICSGQCKKMSIIQSYKTSHLGGQERNSYVEKNIINHKIATQYLLAREDYFRKKEEERKNAKEKIEQEKVLAYQNQYLKFLSEAQSQNIPNARAESIASYAMQHGLYSLPKCPICGSVDTSKIYMGQKMAKGAAFGLVGVADTAGKTWKCNKCGCKF